MSQQQFELSEALSFPDRVKDAITLAGLDCDMIYANEGAFSRLKVSALGNKIVEIIPVDLENWEKQSAKIEYKELLTTVADARLKGKQMIILWEDQWERSEAIVISRVKSLLGISARIPGRLTYISRIDKKRTDQFLFTNHLQGNVSSKYRYGLFLPIRYFRILSEDFKLQNTETDLLVAVATFSNARIFEKNEKPFRSFEMIRFANLMNTTVVGGLNKLLNAFTKDFKPDDIMTYADLEWSDGASYKQLGFDSISDRSPISFWVDEKSFARFGNQDSEKGLVEVTNAGSRKFVKVIEPEKK